MEPSPQQRPLSDDAGRAVESNPSVERCPAQRGHEVLSSSAHWSDVRGLAPAAITLLGGNTTNQAQHPPRFFRLWPRASEREMRTRTLASCATETFRGKVLCVQVLPPEEATILCQALSAGRRAIYGPGCDARLCRPLSRLNAKGT